jgi:DUF4097 and DUF4098 domain-containing protein YvlB
VLLRAILAGCLVLSATLNATDRRSYTFALPAGRGISVELTVGTLRVQGETRADALVEVVRTAPSDASLAHIPVSIEETDQDVRIVGVQAEGGTDAALKTDITLRVPRGALLRSLRAMEGRVTLSDLEGSVTADVRRGSITATNVQGTVRLETGIGDVIAHQMRLVPDGLLRLRTFNGDVRLTLAERPRDARVMALALNGTIQSKIPLTMKDTWGPRWGEATIGTGEPVISIDVVTGRIFIE